MPPRPSAAVRSSRKSRRNRTRRRLRLENLERRRLLAVFTVDSLADETNPFDGLTTLREAVLLANSNPNSTVFGNDIIDFSAGLSGTIELEEGEISILEGVDINGPGANVITIDAQQNSRIFNIDDTSNNDDYVIAGLTLTGGRTTGDNAIADHTHSGGAIRSVSSGLLAIVDCELHNNETQGDYADGGAIFALGNLALTDSTVSGNSTTGQFAIGGGVSARDNVMLSNATISGNSTSGRFAEGGGVSARNSVTLTNSTVADNATSGDYGEGGGVDAGSVVLTNSTVSGNSTSGDDAVGGGVFASAGDVTLTNSTVRGNSTEGFSADGGGIFAWHNVTVSDSTISGNSTSGDYAAGGGVRSLFGGMMLTNSMLSGNRTSGDHAGGGGVFANEYVTLTNSMVSGNSTSGDDAGGGGVFASEDVTLTHSTVSGNSTSGENADGGGVLSRNDMFAVGSTISGNRTEGPNSYGAGLAIDSGFSGDNRIMSFDSTTVTGNVAVGLGSRGGGVALVDDVSQPQLLLELRNSLVAGNLALGGNQPDIALIDDGGGQPTISALFSIIGTNSGNETFTNDFGSQIGTDTSPIDPMLSPLGDYGGPTETHLLLPGSPAIDAGDPNFSPPPDFDQRGAPFDRVAGGRIDIGAVESQSLTPQTRLVDTLVDENDGDYSAGDVSLREAIALANAFPGEETIEFDPALAGSIVLTAGEIVIVEGVDINGPGANVITIDGQQNSRIFNIDDTSNNDDYVIAGLTLTGGRTTGDNAIADHTHSGGAIRSVSAGVLSMIDVELHNNQTQGEFADGGAVFAAGNLTLTDSTLTGNSTSGNYSHGGGLAAEGNITLTDSTVSGNSTLGNYGSRGGGMAAFDHVTLTNSTVSGNSTSGEYADGGGVHAGENVTLTDSTVSGNSTAGRSAAGGGVYAGDNVTLTNSTVSGNSTSGESAPGGGVYAGHDLTLTNSTVSGNNTSGDYSQGGGVFAHDNITLTHSTVSGNSTSGRFSYGGGIFASGYNVALTNSTVSGNSTSGNGARGGGMSVSSEASEVVVELVHSTIVGNTTDGTSSQGGGIAVNTPFVLDPLVLQLSNTIVAQNDSSSHSDIALIGTIGQIDARFSIIGTNSGNESFTNDLGGNQIGTDASPIDPMLSPLGNYGGPTATHMPLPGSLSIDAGDPSFVSPPDFDQRGAPFDRVAEGRIDIGAVESQSLTPQTRIVDTLVDENDGDYSAGDFSLREAIGLTNGVPGEETIEFDPALAGSIELAVGLGQLEIRDDVIIRGDNRITLDALQNSRVIDITDQVGDVELEGLTITGGQTTGLFERGGGIRSLATGELVIDQTTLTGNRTLGERSDGGGVFARYNLTLTNSTVSDNSTSGDDAEGGGVFASRNATLTNSTVSGNSTAGRSAEGGGVFAVRHAILTSSTVSDNNTSGDSSVAGGVHADNVTLTNSTVSGNSTLREFSPGGGVFSRFDVTMTNSTVSDNSTSGESAGGGGIFARRNVALTNSTVRGNSTTGDYADGGGIFADSNDSGVTLTDSTVRGNITSGESADGGGVYAEGNLTLTNTTISGNGTSGHDSNGGGVFAGGDFVTLNNSTVSGNSTTGDHADGGGVYADGNVALASSTISGNSILGDDADGGGMFLRILFGSDPVNLVNSTIVDNSANGISSRGGGIALWKSFGSGRLELSNTIVAKNDAPSNPDIAPIDFGQFDQIDARFSIIGSNSGNESFTNDLGGNQIGTDASPIDPLLSALGDNGGPTQTHVPLPGSPAIDRGDNFGATADQRGAARTVDLAGVNNGPGDGTDIGAVERPDGVGVADVQIDDGSGQRSMVRSITVGFDTVVHLDDGAITLTDDADGSLIPIEVDSSTVNQVTRAVVTFVDPADADRFIGGSLADGRYTLRVDDAKVSVADQSLAADRVDNFHRLFGDADGSAVVDFDDFFDLVDTFFRSAGSPAFNDAFDYNGDDQVDFDDFFGFLPRFFTTI